MFVEIQNYSTFATFHSIKIILIYFFIIIFVSQLSLQFAITNLNIQHHEYRARIIEYQNEINLMEIMKEYGNKQYQKECLNPSDMHLPNQNHKESPDISSIKYVINGEMKGADKNMQNTIKKFIISSNSTDDLIQQIENKYGNKWNVWITNRYQIDFSGSFITYLLVFYANDWEIRIWQSFVDTDIKTVNLADIKNITRNRMYGADKKMQNVIQEFIISSRNKTELKQKIVNKYEGDWQVFIGHSDYLLYDITYNKYSLEFKWNDWMINIWKTRLDQNSNYPDISEFTGTSIRKGKMRGVTEAMVYRMAGIIVLSQDLEEMSNRISNKFDGSWQIFVTPSNSEYRILYEKYLLTFHSDNWVLHIWRTHF